MIKEQTRRNNGPWPSYTTQAKEQLRRARSGIQDAQVRTRDFVTERPFLALAVAVTAGFVVARIVSRY